MKARIFSQGGTIQAVETPPGPGCARNWHEALFFSASRRAGLLAGVILVLATLAAYHNSLAGPFVFDDVWAITENPTIRRLWPPGPVMSPPTNGLTVTGRPLLNLSLAVNYALGGTSVRGYHALNLAIHILAGLTLLGIVRRTLLQPVLRRRFGAASHACGMAVALLWTLHPLQTESVTYVVQRVESLMGLFYLLTLYCFIRGTESPAPGRRFDGLKAPSQSRGWQALAVAACLAGMATKEVMVSAPLMVLLYDRTFVAGTFREAWRQRWRLHAGLAGTWLLLGCLVASTGGNRGGTSGLGVGVPWWAYAATQFRAIVRYLWLTAWPHPLIFEYGTEWIRRASQIVPYALIVVPLVAATLIGLRRRPVPGFAGAWFFAILAPTSLMPGTIQMIVEHRMYLPLAAVLSLAVPGLYALAGRRSLLLFLALAAGLGSLTLRRNEDYRSAMALWSDTVAKRPGNARAHENLGYALFQAGRRSEAVAQYEEALRISPDYSEPHNNLGIALAQAGRKQEALAHYEAALLLNPDYADAHHNLGNALAQAERWPEAIRQYEKALRIRPDFAEAHHGLGIALAQSGRLPEAIRHYAETLRLNPEHVLAHNNLGIALARTGRMPEATRHFEEALRLQPDSVEAHNNLARALVQAGRVPEAISHYEKALRIKPDSAEAHNNLGYVLIRAGRLPEAISHCEAALRIKPDSAETHSNLGYALLQTGRLPEAIRHYEEALRINPNSADTHDSLGYALLQAGRVPEAIRQCEESLRIRPDSAEAHNNLGTLLVQTGRAAEAKEQYEQALRIDPTYAAARDNLARLQAVQRASPHGN